MITKAKFYGGADTHSINSDYQLHHLNGRVRVFTASTGSLKVKLPDATILKTGETYFEIINNGATSFTINDYNGGAVDGGITLLQDKCATCMLKTNGTAAGVWKVSIYDTGTITPPQLTFFPYIFGQVGNATAAKKVQEFDVDGDSWSYRTSSTEHHQHGSSFAIGQNGYAIGSDLSGQAHLNNEQYYGDTWTAKNDPTKRTAGIDILLKGYIIGTGAVATIEEYDNSLDTWTTKSPTGSASGGTGAGILTLGYIMTGWAADYTETYSYNPSTDAFADMADYPAPGRQGNSADQVNNKMYSCGGLNVVYQDDMDEYDPVGNSWTEMTDYPPGNRYRCSTVGCNDEVYVMAGTSGIDEDDCQEFDPSGDSWSAKTDITDGTDKMDNCGVGLVA
jgi:N-acetylneuraminic acid mutarotase